MVMRGNDLRVDEDVRVDGLHGSATVHEVKELVTVKQAHTGLFDSLPAPKGELGPALWPLLRESLSEKIIGHSLERPSLPCSFLLDSFQQVVVNGECRSTHASKCIDRASRCQRSGDTCADMPPRQARYGASERRDFNSVSSNSIRSSRSSVSNRSSIDSAMMAVAMPTASP